MRLNARSPSSRDRLVILVDVVEDRLEDDVRLPLLPQRDERLEDVLAVLGERAHVEVVHGQPVLRNAELGRRLAHLARQRVGRKAVRQRARRDRERDVPHLGAAFDQPRHRAAAAELAVVGVRSQHERPLPLLDQTGTASFGSTAARSPRGTGTRSGDASATSPKSIHVVGSSKNAL